MNVEEEKKLLRSAHMRAIRALRLAMAVLLDASSDIVDNFAGDPGFNEPEEIEKVRVRTWNVMRPLLIQAAKSIEAFANSGNLGADCTADTIKLCEDTLKVLEQDRVAESLEPYLEKLRAWTPGSKDYETLCLQAIFAARGLAGELPPELRGPDSEGPSESKED
jgi:hypothetical protein